MKKIILPIVLVLSLAASLQAQQGFRRYHDVTSFSLTSPGAMKFGLYGYDNPALLSTLHEPDIMFAWSTETGDEVAVNRWGAFIGFPFSSFGAIHQSEGDHVVT